MASRERSARRVVAGMLVLGLALTACAADPDDVDVGELGEDTDDAETTDDGNGDATGEGAADGSVRLVANPWPGSYANAHVAALILEQELGTEVEIVELDENAQWAGLDDGSLDAVLEIWPSGHADNRARFIDDRGTVEDIGELGAVGQIGWFVPSYVVDEYPEMTSWEGLEGNEAIFATAETGNAGQFLAADPSFVQFDETIIENLGLNLTVVQSGSEAAQLTAVETAIEQQQPVLFYFYTPHWLHAQYDLTMVELPEYEEGCDDPEDERTCGYPEDVLFKAATAELQDRLPDVHAFLSAFQLQNEDQDSITFEMDVDGRSPEEAAQAWVDANEDVWRPWLP
ncbi:ABC transporter substrate-binding protein [Nitriliruptor alkaliphilus]|uniref:ABC transporter substrate-binding protein n=1 Tax=Nitriliruptor alkaliphilus TaxID=427918 RepID=UPI0009F81696|nr:ABC transporter substrate-binding protein [Nitriliruptor alkaliphilus]